MAGQVFALLAAFAMFAPDDLLIYKRMGRMGGRCRRENGEFRTQQDQLAI
jgi:hypothetical protein